MMIVRLTALASEGQIQCTFLLCYMISALLCIDGQESYAVRLCCHQYPLFCPFFANTSFVCLFQVQQIDRVVEVVDEAIKGIYTLLMND